MKPHVGIDPPSPRHLKGVHRLFHAHVSQIILKRSLIHAWPVVTLFPDSRLFLYGCNTDARCRTVAWSTASQYTRARCSRTAPARHDPPFPRHLQMSPSVLSTTCDTARTALLLLHSATCRPLRTNTGVIRWDTVQRLRRVARTVFWRTRRGAIRRFSVTGRQGNWWETALLSCSPALGLLGPSHRRSPMQAQQALWLGQTRHTHLLVSVLLSVTVHFLLLVRLGGCIVNLWSFVKIEDETDRFL